ncbi:hydrolase [Clostridium sp. SYSU_GA19001]|uniref:glycoside hydrolase family 113 n=1 Tax=Clostridium caldaquaticum TaxID=2940653 RepID=UPI002077664D|nr:hydrolase [Clostridium caldaquaticum]MCM8711579.1 hydrolase [Clostridium caldaquaticum]
MRRINKVLFMFIILVAIFIISLTLSNKSPVFNGKVNDLKNKFYGKTLNKEFKTKIKAGNLSTDYLIEQALRDIDKLQLNTVNIPVVIHIKDLKATDMTVDEESKKKAVELIKRLRWKKINIILEAYPWIDNGKQYETEWKPVDINKFFDNWKSKVIKNLIDDIAVPYHVDALNVASNFINMESYEASWIDIIDYVRQYYKGLITYRTNWWYKTEDFNKKLNNKLFSKVDFISIAAYFELSNKDINTAYELTEAIKSTTAHKRKQNIEQQLKEFHDKWQKPIFFGELGFPRRNGAAREPWNPEPTKIENVLEQANCFEAYRRIFEDKPWHLGFSVFAIGETSENKNYYPSEESIDIIRKWYKNNNISER